MDMGPKRDIYGEISAEIRKTDMKLLATFHMARSYGYMFSKDHTSEEVKFGIFMMKKMIGFIVILKLNQKKILLLNGLIKFVR